MAKGAKFTGELAEPIIRGDRFDRVWLDFSEDGRTTIMGGDPARRAREDATSRKNIAREERRIRVVQLRRLTLLAKRFGAMKNGRPDWKLLALGLAKALGVPGVQVLDARAKKGRPRNDAWRLIYDVQTKLNESAARGRPQRVSEACAALTKRGQRYAGRNPEVLRTLFHRQKRERDAQIARNEALYASIDQSKN